MKIEVHSMKKKKISPPLPLLPVWAVDAEVAVWV